MLLVFDLPFPLFLTLSFPRAFSFAWFFSLPPLSVIFLKNPNFLRGRAEALVRIKDPKSFLYLYFVMLADTPSFGKSSPVLFDCWRNPPPPCSVGSSEPAPPMFSAHTGTQISWEQLRRDLPAFPSSAVRSSRTALPYSAAA